MFSRVHIALQHVCGSNCPEACHRSHLWSFWRERQFHWLASWLENLWQSLTHIPKTIFKSHEAQTATHMHVNIRTFVMNFPSNFGLFFPSEGAPTFFRSISPDELLNSCLCCPSLTEERQALWPWKCYITFIAVILISTKLQAQLLVSESECKNKLFAFVCFNANYWYDQKTDQSDVALNWSIYTNSVLCKS